MYPVIIDFGLVDIFGFQFHLAIYSFGLMLVIAFYTCYYFLDQDLKEMGYDEKLASDIIFWSALGGIVGSKIYHIIENLDQILASPNPLGQVFSGSGLVFLGGLLGAIIAVTVILNKNDLSWLKFADIISPLILLGYAIGRLGCFLVGDDYGTPSDLPWAMPFLMVCLLQTSQFTQHNYMRQLFVVYFFIIYGAEEIIQESRVAIFLNILFLQVLKDS